MPLLIEYYVVLLLYNISKKFSIKKCPARTLNFPVKSRFFRYLSDLRCRGEIRKRRNFHSTTTEDGYYARIQLLFIDDFSISRYTEEGIKILYHLLKLRDDLGTSPLFSCQYSPDEWGLKLSDEPECYGKLDGIRRRLTTGFTVLIEKA